MQPHCRRRGFALDSQRRLRPGRIIAREQLAKLGIANAAGQSGRTAGKDQADPGGSWDQTRRVRPAAGGTRAGGAQIEDDGGGRAVVGDDDDNGDRESDGDRRRARVILWSDYRRHRYEGAIEGWDHRRRTTIATSPRFTLEHRDATPPGRTVGVHCNSQTRWRGWRERCWTSELLTLECVCKRMHPRVNYAKSEIWTREDFFFTIFFLVHSVLLFRWLPLRANSFVTLWFNGNGNSNRLGNKS